MCDFLCFFQIANDIESAEKIKLPNMHSDNQGRLEQAMNRWGNVYCGYINDCMSKDRNYCGKMNSYIVLLGKNFMYHVPQILFEVKYMNCFFLLFFGFVFFVLCVI